MGYGRVFSGIIFREAIVLPPYSVFSRGLIASMGLYRGWVAGDGLPVDGWTPARAILVFLVPLTALHHFWRHRDSTFGQR